MSSALLQRTHVLASAIRSAAARRLGVTAAWPIKCKSLGVTNHHNQISLARRRAGGAAVSEAGERPGPTGLHPHDDEPEEAAGPGPGSLRGGTAAQEPLPGGLYVIPTPIGNLQDITLRAADTLRRVHLLLAEDTRHTRKLLNFLGIRNVELMSCHEHNEKLRLTRVLQRLEAGEPVGVVSDAGTPGISDPGAVVIAAAVAAGVRVVALPGPCAFVTALVGSGLPTDAFSFVGFLPPKSGARRRVLESLAAVPGTLVMYAPPHGLAAVLIDCVAVLGPARRCCVAREISKLHEEYFRSTLEGAAKEFGEVREARGEIVLLVEGADAAAAAAGGGGGVAGAAAGGGGGEGSGAAAVERVLRELLAAGTPVSSAVKEVVANLGANKKAAYALALRLSAEVQKQQQQQQQQQPQEQQ